MKTSSQGRKFIEGFEGLILQAYDDHNDQIVLPGQHPIGVLTIGYGHTDAAGPPKVYVGQKITQQEADQFLATDLSAVENEVNHLVKVPLNQNQFDALVSFHFNTGALGKSTLLKVLNAGDYKQAAADFAAWNHAGGQVLPGLTRRRQEEANMFLKPYTNTSAGPAAAAGTVVIAGAVAASHPSEHTPLIFLGIVAVGLAIGLWVHYLSNRKATPNVV